MRSIGANARGAALPLSGEPRVPDEMKHACLPICADDDYDFAVLAVDPSADTDWTPVPQLAGISGPGELPITIAGYGFTTMPEGLSRSAVAARSSREPRAARVTAFP